MLKKILKKKMGFTLIELIVAIAIIAITLPTISSVFMYALNQTKDEDVKLTTMTDVQTVIQKLKSQSKYGLDALFVKYYQGTSETMTIITNFNDINALFNKTLDEAGNVTGMNGFLDFKEPIDQDNNDIALLTNFAAYKNGSNPNEYDIPELDGTRYNCNIVINRVISGFYNTYKVTITVTDTQNNNKASTGYALIGGE